MARVALSKRLLAVTGASTSQAWAGCRVDPSRRHVATDVNDSNILVEAHKVGIDSEVHMIEIEQARLRGTACRGASGLHAGLSEMPVANLVVDLGLVLQL